MKRIVYIGNFLFPLGNAVAKRVLGIGKALSLAGYEVVFIGESKEVPLGQISNEETFEQFKYYNIHKPLSAVEHYKYRQDVKRICEKLDYWNKEASIEAVIFCGTKSSLFANSIVKKCRKMNIPTIADSMDWLSSRTGNLVFDIIKQMDTNFELRFVNKKANAVIAISEFLSQYYRKAGKDTVVIPPISPYEKKKDSHQANPKTTFIYAGVPCRKGRELKNPKDAKDRLDMAVHFLHLVHKKGFDFNFQVYGLTKEEYLIIFPKQKDEVEEMCSSEKLHFKGYADESVVREAVEKADYTLLLREQNRVTMAGFPTKIAESIALGTPVITTETSNINKYINDGNECYFLNMACEEETVMKLTDIIGENAEQYVRLRKKAEKNNSFSPEAHSKALMELVERLRD